jgi:23S rRNA (adenine2503-C2)-methyltransferase
MTNLPEALRVALAEETAVPVLTAAYETRSDDGSVKRAYRLEDGALIESVLMFEKEKRTLCVSSQSGCAVGCVFCATGAIGLTRHLTAGEILRQVYDAESQLVASGAPGRLTNVVLMGMGEPMHNFEPVQRALANLVSPLGRGLSPRRITVSTSGYPERIAQLAKEGPPVRLAISLTAADDALRTQLIPLNKRHPIASLLEAGRLYERATTSRVTYEYVLLAGVNDSEEQARQLARLLRGRRVNLIPLNPHPFSPMAPPSPEVVNRFHEILKGSGVTSTVRWSKGREIQAACGQLAAQA